MQCCRQKEYTTQAGFIVMRKQLKALIYEYE